MPAPRLIGSFDDGLDLLGRAGYPVRVPTSHGHLTMTRWSDEVMSAWLQFAPKERGEPAATHADAHALLFLDDGTWRLAEEGDGVLPNPLCGPAFLSFVEDLADGRSGRLLADGKTRDALAATLERGIASLNASFAPDYASPGLR